MTIHVNPDYMEKGQRAPLRPVKLTRQEAIDLELTQANLLINCPFFAELMYGKMPIIPTLDVPIAATDGFAIFINPPRFFKYTLRQRAFALAHEVCHAMFNDCGTALVWRRTGQVQCQGGMLPYDSQLMNVAQDYGINAMLIKASVGEFCSDWLFDAGISAEGMEACVELYWKLWHQREAEKKRGEQPSPEHQPGGQKGDARHDGRERGPARFDEHLEPGAAEGAQPEEAQEARSEAEWRIAVAAAAASAAMQGKLPASLQQFIGNVLTPTVSWQEHMRSTITRRVGPDGYNWSQLDETHLIRPELGYQMVCFPQESSFQAGTIAIGYDVSGSCCNQETATRFFAEMTGIVETAQPRKLAVLWCDAAVQRVDELEEVTDLVGLKLAIDKDGIPGGGGTDFRPVFTDIDKRGIEPDLLVFFTDGYGTFPKVAPAYPVIWAMTTDCDAPWGDVVRVKL